MEEIKGLYYIPNAIDNNIISLLDKQPWHFIQSTKGRKVQQYGYIYNYKSSSVKEKTEDIPEFLYDYIKTLNCYINQLNLEPLVFNQCIVNNYEIDQRINKHIDSTKFGSIVGCYTLGCSGIMRFSKDGIHHDIKVEPNSLYIMSGDARYKWTHEMLKNKEGRRISITFRNV